MSLFDSLYDGTIYTLIMLCYIAAGWMVIMLMMGADTLLDAVVLAMLGTGLSAAFIRIRSQSTERQANE